MKTTENGPPVESDSATWDQRPVVSPEPKTAGCLAFRWDTGPEHTNLMLEPEPVGDAGTAPRPAASPAWQVCPPTRLCHLPRQPAGLSPQEYHLPTVHCSADPASSQV